MRRPRISAALLVVVAATALAAFALPAAAITDGELDSGAHPWVGLMLAQDEDGAPLWRCTGTLLSPTVFLTAGHCTEAPAAHAEVWFDDGPINVDPVYAAARDEGDSSVEACAKTTGKAYPCTGDAGGAVYTHPEYDPAAFFLHDVGVVVLDGPGHSTSSYGTLAPVGSLNTLRNGTKNGAWFTAVGYGLQKAFPDAAAWKDEAVRERRVAYPKLIQINVRGSVGDFAMLLSNNAKTGGTCFGDSGGPNFLEETNVVAGITSFGRNWTCGGTGGVFRTDQQDVHDFVANPSGD